MRIRETIMLHLSATIQIEFSFGLAYAESDFTSLEYHMSELDRSHDDQNEEARFRLCAKDSSRTAKNDFTMVYSILDVPSFVVLINPQLL
jgi:hypothetical protein